MNPEEIQPESPVELEAIVRQNMEANDKLGSIEMNTEANVLAAQETTQGLKDIDATLEAQIHQAETHKKDMMPSMEALGKAMGFAATLLEKLEGPQGIQGEKGDKGDQGEKGNDGADSLIAGPAGRDGVDGRDGTDGRDGRDGIDGKDGKDGIDGKSPKIDYKKIVAETVKRVPEIDIDAKVKKITDAVSQNTNDTLQSIRTKIASKTVSANEVQGLAEFVQENGGGGHTIEDEGTPLTQRTKLNFVGAGVTVTDDAGNDATVVTIPGGGGGGSGDVVGPASATDNAIARFDTTTGKLIQNSAMTVNDAGAFTATDGSKVTGNEGGGFGYIVQAIENTSSGGRAELSLDTDDGQFAGFVAMAGSATTNKARQFDIGTRLTGDIGFWTSDLQQMTLTDTGRLGVGTDDPQAPLDVRGDARIGAISGTSTISLLAGSTRTATIAQQGATSASPLVINTNGAIDIQTDAISRLAISDVGQATFSQDVLVPDEAYGVGWNGSVEVPTKNAIYDKIETIGSTYIQPRSTRMGWVFPDNTINGATDIVANKWHTLSAMWYELTTAGDFLKRDTSGYGSNFYFTTANALIVRQNSTVALINLTSGNATYVNALTASSAKRSALITEMISFCQTNNFDGVDLDLETFQVASMSASQWTDFKTLLQELGDALHAKGLILSMEVPPIWNTAANTESGSGDAWDSANSQGYYRMTYAELNYLPVDQVVVMAYDYQYDYSAGEPNQPLKWFKEILNFARNNINEDRIKIVGGIPSAGYSGATAGYAITGRTYNYLSVQTGFGGASRDANSGELIWANGGTSYACIDDTAIGLKITQAEEVGIFAHALWHIGDNKYGTASASVLSAEHKKLNTVQVESKSITIETPTATEDISMFYTDDAITVTKIVFAITGSTSVTTTIRQGTDRSATGTEVVTGGTVANSTTAGNVVTTFNDATVPADSFIWLETTALSGTPTSLNVTIFYRRD